MPMAGTGGSFARLYGDLAWLWPLVSPAECYEEESECLGALVDQYARRPARSLLHLGCASGQHECALRQRFAITGVDLSPEMVRQARAINPAGVYAVGDLRTARLGVSYDAVLLLDAVNYMVLESDLHAAFETARLHLAPGGVFITLAEYTVESFEPAQPRESRLEHDRVRVIMTEWHEPCPPGATQFTGVYEYRIERNGGIDIERDEHTFGLFSVDTWRELLRAQFGNVTEPDFEETSLTCPVFVCIREE
jgi:SAM-dependent methyltransferase